MIILGERYKFTKFELKKIQKEFQQITFIKYKEKDARLVTRNIKAKIEKESYKLIILNTKAPVSNQLIQYLTDMELEGITFLTIENFLEKYLYKVFIPENNNDISFLDNVKPFTKWQYIQKRFIDFGISIPLGIVTFPIMLYSAWRIKKESPNGSIFFKQKRVGLNGIEFECIKFRSMIPNAETKQPQFASKNDSRVFPWGNIMRKSRIDELPQLWNVIKGDMHLIGPRPERQYWVEQFEENIPSYNQRHLIKPGVTGWAQVCYPYGANQEDARQKLMYDLYYIKNWSLWLEIKTIIKTIVVVLSKKGT